MEYHITVILSGTSKIAFSVFVATSVLRRRDERLKGNEIAKSTKQLD